MNTNTYETLLTVGQVIILGITVMRIRRIWKNWQAEKRQDDLDAEQKQFDDIHGWTIDIKYTVN